MNKPTILLGAAAIVLIGATGWVVSQESSPPNTQYNTTYAVISQIDTANVVMKSRTELEND